MTIAQIYSQNKLNDSTTFLAKKPLQKRSFFLHALCIIKQFRLKEQLLASFLSFRIRCHNELFSYCATATAAAVAAVAYLGILPDKLIPERKMSTDEQSITSS